MKINTPKISLFVFLSSILIASSAHAKKFNPGEFQEDAEEETPVTPDEWPEAKFAEAEDRAKAFNPGEEFNFRAQWGIFRKAGVMTITTSQDKSENFIINTETRSAGFIRNIYPMWLKAETVLDSKELRMVRNNVTGKTRSEETESKTTFDYEKGVMVHDDKYKPGRNGTKDIPYPIALDYASSLLQMRSWDLAVGKRHPLLVSSKGKFYFVEMEVKEIEKINTEDGEVNAFKIEPVQAYPQSKLFREGGKFAVWISTDPDRIPLRLDVKTSVGLASLRLQDYTLNQSGKVAKIDKPNPSSS